jgi:ABC-type nitrate/sulfonate/bicarbonate transport system permease component
MSRPAVSTAIRIAGRPQARSRTRSRNLPPLRGLLPLALLLGLWELVQRGRSTYFPRPSEWWSSIATAWDAGTLGPAIEATMQSFLLALAIATVLGTIIGVLVGRSTAADRLFGPLFEYCRVMPPAAVVPVLVLFTGYTERMKIFVVLFAAIWPILLQVRAAARRMNPVLLDVARTLRLGRRRTATGVLLPALVPDVITGVRLAAPTVLVVVLLVEVVTQVGGIGSLLETAQRNYDSPLVYGLIVLTGVLALLVNWIVELIATVLRRYDPSREG